MNKLASIYFLQGLGLPTIFPHIITTHDERALRAEVDSFYFDYEPGWVLRCGELPKKDSRTERWLPWDVARGKEELIRKVIELQREIGRYFVFCHPVQEMVRGGIMLIEGDKVVVEAARGEPRELSAFYRGSRSPEQQILFNPGMMHPKRYGSEVLAPSDLLELRNVERTLDWSDIGAISDPVSVEFSWLKDGRFYVHDLSVVN
jgi:hypothetical protein